MGEDYEFSRRVAGDLPVFFDPEIIVFHRIPAYKMSMGYLARTGFENGCMKASIGGGLTPRWRTDLLGIDGWISLFSSAGYSWGRLDRLTGLEKPQRHA